MAKHNDVRLLGFLVREPSIRYRNDIEKKDPVQANMIIRTVRGKRDFASKNGRKGYDEILIIARNPIHMEYMMKLREYDVVDVKGSLVTYNAEVKKKCPECEAISVDRSLLTFVNPIFINRIKTVEELEKTRDPELSMLVHAEGFVRKLCELSNNITVLGTCCREPDMFSEKGNDIVNYQIDVLRKYRIREDEPDNKHDFPNIKSYGKIARNDYQYIKKGARLFIDGFLMTRSYTKEWKCPECGYTEETLRSIDEIVPYAVEYLNGCNDGAKEINEAIDRGEFNGNDDE